MSADFTPNQSNYKDLGSFKFWCQKVLPAVYDDSLSYYELLCKVVKHLNEVITNINNLGENNKLLYNAFVQLQRYVNDYFDNLDVQIEINNKLDKMVADGTFGALIQPLFSYHTPELYGAKGDGVTDDTQAMQKCIDASISNGKPIQCVGSSVYLLTGININSPIQLYGNGCTFKAKTLGMSVITANHHIWNPGKWTEIRNITIDMNDKARIGLHIINLHNAIFDTLYIMNFDCNYGTADSPICGIYEEGDASADLIGYERMFNNIVFYANIAADNLGMDYNRHIYAVKTTSAGDDHWTNIVTHSIPNGFDMWNWSTMFDNIHIVGESSFNDTESTCFSLKGHGPYMMNNIYIDNCPYSFEVADVPVLGNNINIVTPTNKPYRSTMFKQVSSAVNYTLRGVKLKNVFAKYDSIDISKHASGGAYPELELVNPKFFGDTQKTGTYKYTSGLIDSFSGSVICYNNFDGTHCVRGTITVANDFATTAAVNYPFVNLPNYMVGFKTIPVTVCNQDHTFAFTAEIVANNENGTLNLYSVKGSRHFTAGQYFFFEFPVRPYTDKA